MKKKFAHMLTKIIFFKVAISLCNVYFKRICKVYIGGTCTRYLLLKYNVCIRMHFFQVKNIAIKFFLMTAHDLH